jgi:protocatechuate 3,4-dioxygenase beta subunit
VAWLLSRDTEDLFDFKWNEEPKPTAGCVLTPHAIYGPYWKNAQPERQDITVGVKGGVYMRLALQIIDISTCKPMPNARVDTWHVSSYTMLTMLLS